MAEKVEYEGISLDNVRYALATMFFLPAKAIRVDELTEAEIAAYKKTLEDNLKYVVPMQHNWENPMNAKEGDTWIQYWIESDDRLTYDMNEDDANGTRKVARVRVRFLGVNAELWAKTMHHLNKRKSVYEIWASYCNAVMLDYVSPITMKCVDYFRIGNTSIAFDVVLGFRYNEYMELGSEPLTYISLASGQAKK